MIVHMPDNRDLVVDVKTRGCYLELSMPERRYGPSPCAATASSSPARPHSGEQGYWSPRRSDFVILFIPAINFSRLSSRPAAQRSDPPERHPGVP
jgi:hypothetical protein